MIHESERRRNWRRVSRAHPCPVCAHISWCSLSVDGRLAACRRVEVDAWRSKTDRAGVPVYLHHLDGAAARPDLPPPRRAAPETPRVDVDLASRVYVALLERLSLADSHRADLERRGLCDDEVRRRGYRTLPVPGRARHAKAMREQFGE